MAPFLGEVGRGEIDGDALWREREPDGVERPAHPLAAFGHRLVGTADNGEGGQARPDLHQHVPARLDALERDRRDRANIAEPPFPAAYTLAKRRCGRGLPT
jgi:hypothetical protein